MDGIQIQNGSKNMITKPKEILSHITQILKFTNSELNLYFFLTLIGVFGKVINGNGMRKIDIVPMHEYKVFNVYINHENLR